MGTRIHFEITSVMLVLKYKRYYLTAFHLTLMNILYFESTIHINIMMYSKQQSDHVMATITYTQLLIYFFIILIKYISKLLTLFNVLFFL